MFLGFTTLAADSVRLKVGAPHIENLLNPLDDSPGPYNQIMSHFSQVQFYVAPQARIDKMFHQFDVDCIFPASTNNMLDPERFIQSAEIASIDAFLFSREPYQASSQFYKKNIGIKYGVSLGGIRQKLKANYVELESNEHLVKLLRAGRIDAFIAYEVDAIATYKLLDVEPDFHLASSPVYTTNEAFVCHRNEKNMAALHNINKVIASIEQSGKLAEMLKNTQF